VCGIDIGKAGMAATIRVPSDKNPRARPPRQITARSVPQGRSAQRGGSLRPALWDIVDRIAGHALAWPAIHYVLNATSSHDNSKKCSWRAALPTCPS
jgi:hypothetical protein